MNQETLAKAEEIVSTPHSIIENLLDGFYNAEEAKRQIEVLCRSEIAKALQEKDEAHKAEIEKIRKVIESLKQEETNINGSIYHCGICQNKTLDKALTALDSAVNQEPT